MLAAEGLKVGRLMLTPRGIDALSTFREILGGKLHWQEVGPPVVCVQDESLGGYSNETRPAGPSERGRRVVLVHRDSTPVERVAGCWQDPIAVGEALGIPRCCIDFYVAAAYEATKAHGEYSHLWPLVSRSLEPCDNPVGRYFDAGFFDHFVCSPGCVRTHERAEQIARILIEIDPVLADELVLEGTFLFGPGLGFHRLEAVSIDKEWAPCILRQSTAPHGELAQQLERADRLRLRNDVLELESRPAQGIQQLASVHLLTVSEGMAIGPKSLPDIADRLVGKRVGVVGATGHLGGISTAALLASGASVAAMSRTRSGAELLQNRLSAAGFPKERIQVGILHVDRDDVVSDSRLAPLDALVFAHNYAPYSSLRELSAAEFRSSLEAQVVLSHVLARAYFASRPDGTIVVLNSTEHTRRPAYAAAKAAQAAYARAVAAEVAHVGGSVVLLDLPAVRRWSTGTGLAPEVYGRALVCALARAGPGLLTLDVSQEAG